MDIASYEYAVSQKIEGKWRLMRWLFILIYICFVGAYFGFVYAIRFIPLGALIPLFLWMLVFFTWKYTKPDYKYVIDEAYITFYRVIGKKQKEVVRIKIADAAYIVPLETALDEIKDFEPKRIYSALPCHACPDSYIILFTDKDGKHAAFMFKATSPALKCLRFYNKSTVLSQTEI